MWIMLNNKDIILTQWSRYGVFIANFDSKLFYALFYSVLLLTVNK